MASQHQRSPRPRKSAMSWPKTTELLGLKLELQPERDALLYPQYAIALHAWFLQQVQQTDPELSATMHDNQAEKNFTLSRLQGPLINHRRGVGVQATQTYHFSITALSQPVVAWISQWIKLLPDQIPIRDAPLLIRNIAIEQPPTTYSKLWRAAKTAPPAFALHFTSPTSFRSRGHHLPLPIPRNLLHSYLRRWDLFAKRRFEMEPFLDWVDQSVVLQRHQLASVKTVAGKRGMVTGFIGTLELGVSPKSQFDSEYGQLFAALGQFAPYCGTGHKTTLGLGGTRLGWQEHWQTHLPPLADQLVSDRIQTLTALFKSQRQRQGERAMNAATLWATVLARRELGDSLQAIAADLEIPYDSAKTYSKLARKALNNA